MLYDNIMIPYDGSASSKAALAEAVRFAKDDLGLTLRIVQIIDTDQLAIDKLEAEGRDEQTVASSAMLQKTYEEVTEEASKALHREIDPLLSGLMNKVYIELLQETQPGGQIVTYAIDNLCDLIVMGSRGLGALRGILGSVSSYVLRRSGAHRQGRHERVGRAVIPSERRSGAVDGFLTFSCYAPSHARQDECGGARRT